MTSDQISLYRRNIASPPKTTLNTTIEYGIKYLQTPIIVVLGHTHCGAITTAATEAEVGSSIPWLIDKIKPAIHKVKEDNPGIPPDEFIPRVIEENVWLGVENLLGKSRLIKTELKKGKVGIIGAIYNIESGAVSWMGAHPNQDELIK